MKAYVGMKIDGRFYAEVEYETIEELKQKATEAYIEADFGELECIDMDIINYDDENGDTHDLY